MQGLFFVKKGRVKVIFNGVNGKEQIVRLAGKGHVLGHRGLMDETYPVSAVAMDESDICFVDNEIMYEALYNNIQLTLALMVFYSKELRAMEERMTFLTQMSNREKLAYFILYLKDVFGYSPSEKEYIINGYINKEELSSLTGISVQNIDEQITDFEKNKFISVNNGSVNIISEEKLQEMIDSY